MTSTALRSRLLATTLICAFTVAGPTWAQTAPAGGNTGTTVGSGTAAAPVTPEQSNEEIVVTGSRIRSPGLTSASPLQVVTAAAINATGAANLQDVLQQSPLVSAPTLSRTNSNFLTSGAGIATIDLRNLGTARTLILVNGRRFVSGLANNQAVDLNTIPTQFIDSVEILTGGASSIYGSDAVAGVVNIKYKTNFQGIEASIQDGISERGDDIRYQANLMIGANIAEGRGNVMVFGGYSNDGAVYSADRRRSAVDQISKAVSDTGVADDLFTIRQPFYSSFAPQGRFTTPGVIVDPTKPPPPPILVGTFDPNNNFIPGFSTNGTATRPADGFNRSAFRTIAIPVERYLLATRATYEIAPGINAFLEGTFAKSHTRTQIEPFPLSTAGQNGVFQGTGGFFPVDQVIPGPGGVGTTIFTNPFVPAGLLAKLTRDPVTGLRSVSFNRRLSDIGDRTLTADRTTYRIVAGVEGDVFKNFHYELYFNYGRTDDNQTGTGQVNLNNFRNALAVIPDPKSGLLVCADPNARAQGCVPANVFGANTLNKLLPGYTTTAAQYINADSNQNAFASQEDIGGNITGNLLENPFGAGPLGVATGFEYRKERSAQTFDALSQVGGNGGNALANTFGVFDVIEGYVEGRLPILADRPFFKDLELRGAGRVSHYSTVGTVYSWNYGGEYSPVNGIRFRVVQARATRAPNVGEAFAGPGQTFPTGLQDPCLGVTLTTPGALGANCRAAPGVLANIAANGAFAQNQSDVQGVSGFDFGNPKLREERADTLTFGVVIAPKGIDLLRNTSFTVDYARTRIKRAIILQDRQFTLNQCYNSGVASACDLITRRPGFEGSNSPGSLQFINATEQNSGGIFESSIDATANWNQRLDKLGINGRVDVSFAYTHVFNAYSIPTPGAPLNHFENEVQSGTSLGGSSRDRFLLTTGLTLGGVALQYRGTYIGPAFLDDQFLAGITDANGNAIGRFDRRARIKAIYYSDLQLQLNTAGRIQFYTGVNNLFDVSPPPIISGLPGNVTGAETDSGTYDAIGRRFYAGIRVKL